MSSDNPAKKVTKDNGIVRRVQWSVGPLLLTHAHVIAEMWVNKYTHLLVDGFLRESGWKANYLIINGYIKQNLIHREYHDHLDFRFDLSIVLASQFHKLEHY